MNRLFPEGKILSFTCPQRVSLQQFNQGRALCFSINSPAQTRVTVARPRFGIEPAQEKRLLNFLQDRGIVVPEFQLKRAGKIRSFLGRVYSETTFTCDQPSEPVPESVVDNRGGFCLCSVRPTDRSRGKSKTTGFVLAFAGAQWKSRFRPGLFRWGFSRYGNPTDHAGLSWPRAVAVFSPQNVGAFRGTGSPPSVFQPGRFCFVQGRAYGARAFNSHRRPQ